MELTHPYFSSFCSYLISIQHSTPKCHLITLQPCSPRPPCFSIRLRPGTTEKEGPAPAPPLLTQLPGEPRANHAYKSSLGMLNAGCRSPSRREDGTMTQVHAHPRTVLPPQRACISFLAFCWAPSLTDNHIFSIIWESTAHQTLGLDAISLDKNSNTLQHQGITTLTFTAAGDARARPPPAASVKRLLAKLGATGLQTPQSKLTATCSTFGIQAGTYFKTRGITEGWKSSASFSSEQYQCHPGRNPTAGWQQC